MTTPNTLARACAWLALVLLAAPLARADIVAAGGWSRATVPGASTAVGYLQLTNTGTRPRSLQRIESPAAGQVMIHRTSMEGGMARMAHVAQLTLQPGESVRFDPNGLHLMFMDIRAPFVAGTRVPLKLQFDGEKPLTVMLEVRPLVPAAPSAAHPH